MAGVLPCQRLPVETPEPGRYLIRLGDLYATSPRAVGLTLFVNGFNSVRLEWYQRLPPEWRALEPLRAGCGAFGGNRVAMALLQVIAARLAGLDRLVVHTVTSAGTPPLHQALDYVRGELQEQSPLSRRERG